MKFVDLLASYLPSIIVKELLESGDEDDIAPTRTSYETVCLFADVSGFTAMSESMTESHGPSVGAEYLAKHLNSYFSQLVKIIASEGGDVFKFAGDAMIILWPASQLEDMVSRTRRAVQCAIRVQQLGNNLTFDRDVTLSVKMGIGVGTLAVLRVGGIMQRREYLAVGEPLIQAFAAEQLAQPGDVVVSPRCWGIIHEYFKSTKVIEEYNGNGSPQPELQTKEKSRAESEMSESGSMRSPAHTPDIGSSSSFRRIDLDWSGSESLRKRNKHFYANDLNASTKNQEALIRRYVPGAVLRALHPSRPEFEFWTSEVRSVTTLFVHLGLQDHDLLAAAEYDDAMRRVHAALTSAQRAVYQFEGSVNKFLMDDKGSTLVVVFGLPPYSHQNDPLRAVLCAMTMVAKLRKYLRLQATVGITTGRAFCGVLGSQTRKEYSVLGDTVNLSARLMQAARSAGGGTVLCDTSTYHASHQDIRYCAFESLTIKGKSHKVPVFCPQYAIQFRRHQFESTQNSNTSNHINNSVALELSPRLCVISTSKPRTNRISTGFLRMIPPFKRPFQVKREGIVEESVEVEHDSSLNDNFETGEKLGSARGKKQRWFKFPRRSESKGKREASSTGSTVTFSTGSEPNNSRSERIATTTAAEVSSQEKSLPRSDTGTSFSSVQSNIEVKEVSSTEAKYQQQHSKQAGAGQFAPNHSFAVHNNPLHGNELKQSALHGGDLSTYQALLGAPTKQLGTLSYGMQGKDEKVPMSTIVTDALKRTAEKAVAGISNELQVSDVAIMMKGSELAVPLTCALMTPPASGESNRTTEPVLVEYPIPLHYLRDFAVEAYNHGVLSVPSDSSILLQPNQKQTFNFGYSKFCGTPGKAGDRKARKGKKFDNWSMDSPRSPKSKSKKQIFGGKAFQKEVNNEVLTSAMFEKLSIVAIPSNDVKHTQSTSAACQARLLAKKIILVENGIGSTTVLTGPCGIGKSYLLDRYCTKMLPNRIKLLNVSAHWASPVVRSGYIREFSTMDGRTTDGSEFSPQSSIDVCWNQRCFSCIFDIIDQWILSNKQPIVEIKRERQISKLVSGSDLVNLLPLLNPGLGMQCKVASQSKGLFKQLDNESSISSCNKVLELQGKLLEYIVKSMVEHEGGQLCISIDNGNDLDPQSLGLIHKLSRDPSIGLMIVIAIRPLDDCTSMVSTLSPLQAIDEKLIHGSIDFIAFLESPFVEVLPIEGLSDVVAMKLVCSWIGDNVVEIGDDMWDLCVIMSNKNPLVLKHFIHFLLRGGARKGHNQSRVNLLSFDVPHIPRYEFTEMFDLVGVKPARKGNRKASKKNRKDTLAATAAMKRKNGSISKQTTATTDGGRDPSNPQSFGGDSTNPVDHKLPFDEERRDSASQPQVRVDLAVPKERLQEVEYELGTFDLKLQRTIVQDPINDGANSANRQVKSRRIPSSAFRQKPSSPRSTTGENPIRTQLRRIAHAYSASEDSFDGNSDLADTAKLEGDDDGEQALYSHISRIFMSKTKSDIHKETARYEWNSIEIPPPYRFSGLLGALVDRLSPFEQLVLKVASVIGRVFTLRHLEESYPVNDPNVVGKIRQICERLSHVHGVFYITKSTELRDDYVYKFRNDFLIGVLRRRLLAKQRSTLERKVQSAAVRYRATLRLVSLQSGEMWSEHFRVDDHATMPTLPQELDLYYADTLCFGSLQIQKHRNTTGRSVKLRSVVGDDWKYRFVVVMQDRFCIYRTAKEVASGVPPVQVGFLSNAIVALVDSDDPSDESMSGSFTIDTQCWTKKSAFHETPRRFFMNAGSLSSANYWVAQLLFAVECCSQLAGGKIPKLAWPVRERLDGKAVATKLLQGSSMERKASLSDEDTFSSNHGPSPTEILDRDTSRMVIHLRFGEITLQKEGNPSLDPGRFTPYASLTVKYPGVRQDNVNRKVSVVAHCEARPYGRVEWNESFSFSMDWELLQIRKEVEQNNFARGFLEVGMWSKTSQRVGSDKLLGYVRIPLDELYHSASLHQKVYNHQAKPISSNVERNPTSDKHDRMNNGGYSTVGDGTRYSAVSGSEIAPLPDSGAFGSSFQLSPIYSSYGRKIENSTKVFLDISFVLSSEDEKKIEQGQTSSSFEKEQSFGRKSKPPLLDITLLTSCTHDAKRSSVSETRMLKSSPMSIDGISARFAGASLSPQMVTRGLKHRADSTESNSSPSGFSAIVSHIDFLMELLQKSPGRRDANITRDQERTNEGAGELSKLTQNWVANELGTIKSMLLRKSFTEIANEFELDETSKQWLGTEFTDEPYFHYDYFKPGYHDQDHYYMLDPVTRGQRKHVVQHGVSPRVLKTKKHKEQLRKPDVDKFDLNTSDSTHEVEESKSDRNQTPRGDVSRIPAVDSGDIHDTSISPKNLNGVVASAAAAAAVEFIKKQQGSATVHDTHCVLERFYNPPKAVKVAMAAKAKRDGDANEEELLVFLGHEGSLQGPQPLSYFAQRLAEGTVDPDLQVFSPLICDTDKPLAEFQNLSRAMEVLSDRQSVPANLALAKWKEKTNKSKSRKEKSQVKYQGGDWSKLCLQFSKALDIPPGSWQMNSFHDGNNSKNDPLKPITMTAQKSITCWEFDLFALPNERSKHGMIASVFRALRLDTQFSVSSNTFSNFVDAVSKDMTKNKAVYHNFDHACDVLQATFVLLYTYSGAKYLESIEVFGLAIAALCHDLDHPGQNNSFQIRAQSELSFLYNDKSVLENHHSSRTFKILRSKSCNITQVLTDVAFRELRKVIVDCILATDMTSHFGLTADLRDCATRYLEVSEFNVEKNVSHKREASYSQPKSTSKVPPNRAVSKSFTAATSNEVNSQSVSGALSVADRLVFAKALLHCADISNPTRPWNTSKVWADRVLEEFFKQGDMEKKQNWPVSPNMDRETTSQSQMSLNFIDFIVAPVFLQLVGLMPGVWSICETMAANRKKWEQELESKLLLQEMAFGPGKPSVSESSAAQSNQPELNNEAELEKWQRRHSAFERMMNTSVVAVDKS